MYQTITQLAHMPLQLCCLSDGTIAFARSQHFTTIWESNDDYEVCIDSEGISFTGKELDEPLDILYNTQIHWQDKPILVKWLQSMQLQQPMF